MPIFFSLAYSLFLFLFPPFYPRCIYSLEIFIILIDFYLSIFSSIELYRSYSHYPHPIITTRFLSHPLVFPFGMKLFTENGKKKKKKSVPVIQVQRFIVNRINERLIAPILNGNIKRPFFKSPVRRSFNELNHQSDKYNMHSDN